MKGRDSGLDNNREDVIQSFTLDMCKLFGRSMKKVVLYGSYARGDYQENSDIDIMILTSLSDEEIRKIEFKVYDIAFEYEMMYEVMISVNVKNEEHFNYWLGALPYYDNVKREGIVLAG